MRVRGGGGVKVRGGRWCEGKREGTCVQVKGWGAGVRVRDGEASDWWC